jgi:hypothetical protein
MNLHTNKALTMSLHKAIRIAFFVLIFTIALAQERPVKTEIGVPGNQAWTDTGIDLKPGDTILISATGSLTSAGKAISPEGAQRNWRDLLRTFPLNDASRAALVGRVGPEGSRPFLIGKRRESRVPVGGRLFLGPNLPSGESAEGAFKVSIERTPGQAPAPVPPESISRLTQDQLESIPLRVVDDAGTQGDRVNFLIVGSEEKVRGALQSAGWTTVDKTVKDTVLRGALASLSRQAYTTLPMSELKVFGRSQDYGYAQGDPLRVVASRHHFRIWRAPFTVDGRTVWVGAGTHDVGFDRDQRNNKITHRIDSDVDKERDYIGRSLSDTGAVALLDYMTAKETVRTAKTAHGQEFFSDGRTLVIYLTPDSGNLQSALGDIFCSVLRKENPDTGEWGACSEYFQGGGKEDLDLPAIPNKYKVLVVPGFMSSCFSDAPAFQEGQEHLKSKGLTVEILPVGNDSSEENAKTIANYLAEQFKSDPRKYIVLGYSKGTPDVQVALANHAAARDAVAAFVSVAGAAGGSPIADSIPGQADRWIQQFKMDKCKGDISQGFKSLRRDVRQAFLSSYPHPFVPTYSLVALSTPSNTSKALLQSWELLRVFDAALDGQVTKSDAIIPEAKYLGAALADHFAIALPFDKSPDQLVRSNMGSRYPRAALMEAVVRLVVQDLK